jgi:hypothetical protein
VQETELAKVARLLIARLQLEAKDQMRARGVPSPDEWDAVALTFAEPVSSTPSNFNRKIEYPKCGVI